MKIQIANSNRFGRLAPSALKEFEKELGRTLPEDYRRHLLKHNGGIVKGVRELQLVHHVYGLHNGPDWAQFPDRRTIYDGRVPPRLLPIADDPCGNLICIVLNGKDRGKICFWDHECGPKGKHRISVLGANFDNYLKGLAFIVALANDRLTTVVKWARGFGKTFRIYAGRTMSDLAIVYGSKRAVEVLLETGSKPSADAILEAVRNDDLAIVRELVESGLDVNYTIPETGFTALMLAASGNSIEIAQFLLHHGAKRSPRNNWGKRAVDLAHTGKMKRLLLR